MSKSSSLLGSRSERDSEVILCVHPAYVPLSVEFLEWVIRMTGRDTAKVVFVSCLTLVPHATGGMLLPIGMVNKPVRQEAELHQLELVKLCVKEFLPEFSDKKVALEVRVMTGQSIDRIVQKAAREILPRWIILDSSLSAVKRRLEDDPDLHSFNMGFLFEGKLFTRTGVRFFDSPASVDTSDELAVRRKPPCRRDTVSCLGLFSFRSTNRQSPPF